MSLVISMYVREGIVIASDSRLTLDVTQKDDRGSVVHTAVGLSDTNYKTFLAPNGIGIATYGAAAINSVPIAGYIESFIIERIDNETDIDEVPDALLSYFSDFEPVPDAKFIVAGYKPRDGQKHQQVWGVELADGERRRVNTPGQQGVHWGGDVDIVSRLVHHVAVVDRDGAVKQMLPHYAVPWQFFTLQDAVDFCIFAVRSTIDAIRFQPRPKTVGGPIDVLVIKPDTAFWVRRKELHS